MRSSRVFLSVCLIAVCLAGCIQPTSSEPVVLVLEYTLTPHPQSEGSAASPGHHCGTAKVDGDVVTVQRGAYEAAGGNGRLLYIDPTLNGPVATFGSQPFVMGFPAEVSAGIHDRPDPWVLIGVGDDGRVRVDGNAVDLPHAWEVQIDGWHIDAILQEGPRQVVLEPNRPCY